MKILTFADVDRLALAFAKNLPKLMGAVSNSAVVTPSGIPITPATNLVTFTVIATADADVTTGNIAHLLSFTPTFVILTPILPMGALKAWSWDAANTTGTNVVLVGNNVAGSGNAGAQLRAWVGRLHSIIQ